MISISPQDPVSPTAVPIFDELDKAKRAANAPTRLTFLLIVGMPDVFHERGRSAQDILNCCLSA